MFNVVRQNVQLGDKVIELETGFFANQADGAVMARCGDTSVLCTVCTEKKDSADVDFFPLTVNYQERQYAGGKIPGGFFKREGKQSEREILISRLIDRPIRPIFVDGYYRNTQIICTLMSYDGKSSPDIVALIGASAAVTIAGLPTQGVISGCRVGYINGEYVINPTNEELKHSDLDLVVAGTTNAVLMVESEAHILTEEEMLGAIAAGQEVINTSVEQIKEFARKVNKKPTVDFVPRDRSALYAFIEKIAKDQVKEAFAIKDKHERHAKIDEIGKNVKEEVQNFIDFSIFNSKDGEGCCCDCEDCDCNDENKEGKCNCGCKCCEDKDCCDNCDCECDCCEGCECEGVYPPLVTQNGETVEVNDVDIKLMYEELQSNIVRSKIMKEKVRIDGRQLDEVRPIDVQVGVLPVVHGSAVFSRGLTQVMAVSTLGGTQDEQQSDSMTDPNLTQRFMLHYNFPGFSAGEATPPKAPGRRELGHGNLARRALEPVLPSKEEFPYTIRVVGEVLSSDGSTSQATVCSSCLAMMDMGVPLKAPVAGVAMGLIKEKNSYAVLTDIMADEDHLGDMDFKVAGPLEGITALQMDIKTFGITLEIMRDALAQAKKAREHIMSKMLAVLPAPRTNLNDNAPKVLKIQIAEKKIPDLIGKGGANIKKICEVANVKVNVEQNGEITIFANNNEDLAVAMEIIQFSVGQIPYGKIFNATVKTILSFGVMVDVGNDCCGLVHISEISNDRIDNIENVLSEGQPVMVKFVGCDEKGRYKFSIRQVNQETGEDLGSNEAEQPRREERHGSIRPEYGNRKPNRNENYRKNNFRGKDSHKNKPKKRGILSIFRRKRK